jgi:uncharacterized membrane protein
LADNLYGNSLIVYNLIKNEKILALSKSAENILAERYAKGELTESSYHADERRLEKVQ